MFGAMRPSERLHLHRRAIREIALRHRAADVLVFGSAVTGQDREDSDLDLLVRPTSQTSLMDIGAIQFEVSELLGIPVDVLTPDALPDHIRQQVLREASPV
jgi:predicted nucleotidyltransferase